MASFSKHDIARSMKSLVWPLRLTWFGMVSENLMRALWPLMTVVMAVLAFLMMGLHDMVPLEAIWICAVVAGAFGLVALFYAFRKFRLPSREQALARLDTSLPGRPIQALRDSQAIGASDAASTAVWRAHQARMAARAETATPVAGDLRIADRDPYALRYAALLALVVAVFFGSLTRVGSVTDLGAGGTALANGPVWEGWLDAPRYTGKPTIYLNDIPEGPLSVPSGSLITLRMYGEVGALTLSETVSGRTEVPPASNSEQDFTILQDGTIAINGPGGRVWDIAVVEDAAPRVAVLADPEASALGQMTLPFAASDDYGVEAGEARIALDLKAVTRTHGLAVTPEMRGEIVVPLPMPISGDRAEFEENLVEDFSEHPWSNLPVTITLTALDASEQITQTAPRAIVLPGRRFFDPAAAAIIEQRRDLLWSRSNAGRVAQILRAVVHRPSDIMRSEVTALRLRQVIRSLETQARLELDTEQQEAIAADLWALALELEEGDLQDALERMRRAQERLSQAMRDGASDAEIQELMQELSRATEDYMNQLRREAQQRGSDEENGAEQRQNSDDALTLTQDDIQRMMDRIQELMEQGRMAEAEEALREFQEMMENMQMSQQQGGEGSAGEQAMEDLSESLRNQQGLSDQAFRDLQEQFNPNAQTGESRGNEGRNGGQGQGQSHEGQGGEGEEQGQQQGEGGTQSGQSGADEQSLADRQQALRDELNRQQGSLPGAGTPEGQAARDALDRAGRAMDDAAENLRNDDLAGAIDDQAQAMQALRDGLQALGEQLAQENEQQQQGQGNAEANRQAQNTDPLGRNQGNGEGGSSDGELLQGEDVYRRAQDLLDEIRRRSGENERSEVELDYLKRLLDRF
ncbi:TIGR02302 family protein [Ascidiaceihabitans sp.]|uniref:TIGR02302 family protein n=1 Tax=Ascidiaceihabitans sp. TaxID=1872644 RepID=UPI00329937C9